MTGPPPIKVDIVAGENTAIPALQRTSAEIVRVTGVAKEGLSPMQRLGKALAMEEGRAGSSGLRILRGSMVELAAQATGTQSMVARLAESVGLMAGGGELALTVAAGVGIVAGAYQLLKTEAAAAREEQDAFLKSLAKIGPVAAERSKVALLREQLGDVDAQIAVQKTLAEKFGTEEAGAHLIDLQTQRAGLIDQIAEGERKITQEITKQTEALERQTEKLHRHVLPVHPGDLLRGRGTAAPGLDRIFQRDLVGPEGLRAEGFLMRAALRVGGARPTEVTEHERPPRPEHEDRGQDVDRLLSAIFSATGAVARRDPFAALGGLASGASGIKGLAAATASHLGIAGTVFTGIGALTSLFSSGRAKIVISDFEQQAMEKLKEVRGDPATTSFTILGASGAGTAYDLSRLAARGVVARFPGSR